MASSTTVKPPRKVRCPACGARNEGTSVKCRICGNDLRGQVERPMSQPVPGSEAMRSARLSGVIAMGVAVVVLLGILAMLLDVVPAPRFITDVRNRIPFLSQEADDGWTAFTEREARFRAELPVDRQQGEVPLATVEGGVAREWVAGLGGTATVPDTELSITWGTVPTTPGENVEASLASAAEAWAAQLGGRVEVSEDATFAGFPARRVTVTRLEQGNQDATAEVLLVRRRDQLVILTSRSVYPDHPQFSRLVGDFSFL